MDSNNHITFRKATKEDALFIAWGFHTAMLMEETDDARIGKFAELICSRNDVLYSARNTLIAQWDGVNAGMVTAYDGRYYRGWREKTFELFKEHIGIEFPGMEDEAVPGEYYIDSLAVCSEFRGRGIGRALLECTIAEGLQLGRIVTLAVDPENVKAQLLYESLGFRRCGTLFIFGHDYWKMMIEN